MAQKNFAKRLMKNVPQQCKQQSIGSFNLIIATYNLLADSCIQAKLGQYYQLDQNGKIPQQYLFENRGNKIIQEIQNHGNLPDILCLQEVDKYEEFYRPELEKLGYRTQQALRITPTYSYAVCIGYKQDEFELIEEQIIDLEKISETYKDNKQIQQSDIQQFYRSNKGIVQLLNHKKSQQKLVVSNIHILWDPKMEHIKYAQGYYTLKHISQFLNKHNLCIDQEKENNVPVIICGDFNSLPNDDTMHLFNNKFKQIDDKINLMTTQYCQYYQLDNQRSGKDCQLYKIIQDEIHKDIGHLGNILGKLQSSYSNYKQIQNKNNQSSFDDQDLISTESESNLNWSEQQQESHPKYTNYEEEFQGTLDYIFYTPNNTQLVSLLEMPDHEQVSEQNVIPNKYFPSDHLRLQVELQIMKRK